MDLIRKREQKNYLSDELDTSLEVSSLRTKGVKCIKFPKVSITTVPSFLVQI